MIACEKMITVLLLAAISLSASADKDIYQDQLLFHCFDDGTAEVTCPLSIVLHWRRPHCLPRSRILSMEPLPRQVLSLSLCPTVSSMWEGSASREGLSSPEAADDDTVRDIYDFSGRKATKAAK